MNPDIYSQPSSNPIDASDELSIPDSQQDIVMPTYMVEPDFQKSSPIIHRKTLLAGIIPSAVAVLLIVSFIGWRIISNQNNNEVAQNDTNPITSIDLRGLELSVDKLTSADALIVNGSLVVNSSLVLSPQNEPTNPQTGQLYFDKSSLVARIYDGTKFNRLFVYDDGQRVCLVGADCGFSSANSVAALSSQLAATRTQIATLTTQFTGVQTPTDLGGINSSIVQLQADVAAIPPPPSLASYFQNGGNAFGVTAVLGTSTNSALNIVTNGQAVASLSNTGQALFKNATNSTTSFQVQDSSANTILTIDTTSQRVGIGTNAPVKSFHLVGDSQLEGTVTVGDLLPFTTGSTTPGTKTTSVLTASNVTYGMYNDSQKLIRLGQDGFPRFVYHDNNYTDLHYVRCLDADCITKVDTIVVSDSNSVDTPNLVMGSDGFARILYITYDNPNELHFIRCSNGDCTVKTDTMIAVGGVSDYLYETNFALGNDGFARVAYNDYATNELKFIQCTNIDCSTRNSNVMAAINYGSTIIVKMASDGFPRIVYYDNLPLKTLIFMKCTNADCSSKTSTVIDTITTYNIYYIDTELGSDGLARVVYNRPSNDGSMNGLVLLRCLDDTCATKTVASIDSNSNLHDTQMSLILDSNDLPKIAYQIYPYRTGANFASCTDMSCNTFVKHTLITGAQSGYPVSIVLGADNFPRILYTAQDKKTWLLTRFITQDGSGITAPGTNFGSSSAYFGRGYMQGLSMQGSSVSSLLSLDNYNVNGALVDFKFQGSSVGTLSAKDEGIVLDMSSANKKLTINAVTDFSKTLTATTLSVTNGANFNNSIVVGAYINQSLDGCSDVVGAINNCISGYTGAAIGPSLNRLGGAMTGRYTVTGTGLVPNPGLFTGHGGANASIAPGVTGALTIDFNPSLGWTADTGTGFAYQQGQMILSFYAGEHASNVTVEAYMLVGGTDQWKTIYQTSTNTSSPLIIHTPNGNWTKKIRISMSNPTKTVYLQGVEWYGEDTSAQLSSLPHYSNDYIDVGIARLQFRDQASWNISSFITHDGNAAFGLLGTNSRLFVGSSNPNSSAKLAITTISGYSAFSISDELNQEHFAVSGNGSTWLNPSPATAISPDVSSPAINLTSTYWNGTTSVGQGFSIADVRYGGNSHALWLKNADGSGGIAIHSGGSVSIGEAFGNDPTNLGQLHVRSLSASNIGLGVRGAVGQSADLFQLQNSSGTVLSKFDASGNLTVASTTVNGTLTVNGHVISGNSSGTTAVAIGANAGAGATVSLTGNDTSGTVTITTGTGSTAGILGTITFSSGYTFAPRIVMTPVNANGSTLQYFYNSTTGNFTIRTNNAPVDATQYQFSYWAVQ